MREGDKIMVSIAYENGLVLVIDAAEWPNVRADGVQEFVISVGKYSTRFHAASIYWLYPEGDCYVAGCGCVRYDPNPLNEVIVMPNGVQQSRRVEFMPDLKHDQIKLGWWKHG